MNKCTCAFPCGGTGCGPTGAQVAHREHVLALDKLSHAEGRYLRAEAALQALNDTNVLCADSSDTQGQVEAKAQAHDALRRAY